MPSNIPEGWTAHSGGPMPVDDDARVNLMFRDSWTNGEPYRAGDLDGQFSLWKWVDHRRSDIIAYQAVTS